MWFDAGGCAVCSEVQGEWKLHLGRDLFHRGELESLDMKHHYLGPPRHLHLDPRARPHLAPAAPVPLPLAIDLLLPGEPPDAGVQCPLESQRHRHERGMCHTRLLAVRAGH